MSDETPEIPVAATLEAVIIRACTVHPQCALTCPERKREDLGVIARIDKEN